MGMAYRIVLSEKTLAEEGVELKNRATGEVRMVKLTTTVDVVQGL
jgi:prolyl-tRNA synthetase